MKHVDFNRFAENYKDIHNEAITITGEESGYFDFYKLSCLKRWVFHDNQDVRILDFGCGVGKITMLLGQDMPNAEITGFDVSEKSIEFAQAACQDIANISFVNHIPEDRSFDYIHAANVFHHIQPKDRLQTLEMLHARLENGGQLIIFEHNPLNPLTRYSVRICPFDEDAVLVWPNHFVRLAQSVGFELVMKKYIVFFPHVLRFLRGLEPHLSFLCLGAQYFLVLEKKK